MKHKQNDLKGNPIYICKSCRRSHEISIILTKRDYNVNCLECNQEMRRDSTLESPTTYIYTCTNEQCRQFNVKIQVHEAKI